MKFFQITIIAFILAGCIKEKTTDYKAYLKNNTMHTIECRPYFMGVNPTEKIIRLLPSETLQIASGFDRGIVHAGFTSKYFAGTDSVLVIYDNLYSIIHYVNTPLVLNPKHYLYSSLRNLGNYYSFVFTYQDKSKYSRIANYNYVFTEQDYLDAK